MYIKLPDILVGTYMIVVLYLELLAVFGLTLFSAERLRKDRWGDPTGGIRRAFCSYEEMVEQKKFVTSVP